MEDIIIQLQLIRDRPDSPPCSSNVLSPGLVRSAQSPAVSGHTPRRRRESQGRDPSVRQNLGETGAWSGDIRGIYIDQEG